MSANKDAQPLGVKIKLINEKIKQHFNDQLKNNNLTVSQFWVLRYLQQHDTEKVSQKDLAEAVQVTHPTMIGLIDRLEEKGMVLRMIDENDRRYRYIRLTDQGRQYLKQSKDEADSMNSCLVKGFTQDENKILRNLLDRMYENISEIERGTKC
ncbi:MAG: MarR family transcriptional regulator [Faecalicoccus sp.]|nr:MarR family transcriptional regulator [Faecalicoccus sp.]